MLGDGHQFQMGKAHVCGIGHQLLGQLVPVQPTIPFFDLAPPGAQVDLVDAHRRIQRVGALALRRRALRRRQGGDDAGSGRTQLGLAGIGIDLLRQQLAIARQQLELVARPRSHAGQEDLPHATFAAQAHRVTAPVPEVEVADDAGAHRVGCPHRKAAAGDALLLAGHGAEDLEGTQVRAFAQQPGVHLAEHRAEAIGVLEQRALAVGPLHLQAIGQCSGHRAFEQAGRITRLQGGERLATATVQHIHARRAGQKGGKPDVAFGVRVGPEHGKGIGMPTLTQRQHVLRRQPARDHELPLTE